MKIERAGEKALQLGLFSFFVLITIGYISTSNYSRLFIEPLRAVAAVALVFFIGIILSTSTLCRRHLTGLALYASLLAIGISLALLNDSLAIGSIGLLTNIAVTLCGILLFNAHDKNILSDRFAAWVLAYVIIGTLFTILIKGLEFTPFPRFNFEYDTSINVMDITYSQELSKFFGFGAAAAALLSVHKKTRLAKYFHFFLAITFLFFSLIGGARGDSIAAFFLVISYFIILNPARTLSLLALTATGVYLGVTDWSWLNNFPIFERLLDLNNNLGQRDVLLAQAFNLLLNEPACLIVGCGFGYFQHYFGYEFGMYPHNTLIELFIVFGAPVALTFIATIAGGLWQYYRRSRKLDLLILFFIYSLLVELKSGVLFGNWFFTAGCIYFSSVYVEKMALGTPFLRGYLSPLHHPAMVPGGGEA